MKSQLLNGYEVDTCVELPVKDGEPDYDNAKHRRFDVPTKALAVALASRLVADDCWGAVAVTEFIREPYEPGCPALRKEYVGDTEYIES